jgi:hypothetical protein
MEEAGDASGTRRAGEVCANREIRFGRGSNRLENNGFKPKLKSLRPSVGDRTIITATGKTQRASEWQMLSASIPPIHYRPAPDRGWD